MSEAGRAAALSMSLVVQQQTAAPVRNGCSNNYSHKGNSRQSVGRMQFPSHQSSLPAASLPVVTPQPLSYSHGMNWSLPPPPQFPTAPTYPSYGQTPFYSHQQPSSSLGYPNLSQLSYQQLLSMTVPNTFFPTSSVSSQPPYYGHQPSPPLGSAPSHWNGAGHGQFNGSSPAGVSAGYHHNKEIKPQVASSSSQSYFCEPCDKEFTAFTSYQAHLQTHEKCTHPDCNFSGSKKVCYALYM